MNNDKDLVYAEIAKLSTLPIADLRQLWKEKFGKDAPNFARKTMLLDRLVYHFRELAFGGMSAKAKERLGVLKDRLNGNSDKKYPLLNIFFNKSVKVIANSSAI
jgi:hypothetical protein